MIDTKSNGDVCFHVFVCLNFWDEAEVILNDNKSEKEENEGGCTVSRRKEKFQPLL